MGKYLVIYEEAFCHKLLCNCAILNFLLYEDNFILFFISVSIRESGWSKNFFVCTYLYYIINHVQHSDCVCIFFSFILNVGMALASTSVFIFYTNKNVAHCSEREPRRVADERQRLHRQHRRVQPQHNEGAYFLGCAVYPSVKRILFSSRPF